MLCAIRGQMHSRKCPNFFVNALRFLEKCHAVLIKPRMRVIFKKILGHFQEIVTVQYMYVLSMLGLYIRVFRPIVFNIKCSVSPPDFN